MMAPKSATEYAPPSVSASIYRFVCLRDFLWVVYHAVDIYTAATEYTEKLKYVERNLLTIALRSGIFGPEMLLLK
jgi:hypothetical protein